MIGLVRTSTDPDERVDFFERQAGCHERCVTIRTDWAEMRIAEDALRSFAAAAEPEFRFRVHGGDTQISVPSTGAPTLYLYRFVVLGDLPPDAIV